MDVGTDAGGDHSRLGRLSHYLSLPIPDEKENTRKRLEGSYGKRCIEK